MRILVTSFLFFVFCFSSVSQENFDIVLKTDGDEMVGRVLGVSEDSISFNYKYEKIPYSISTRKVVKITFASGRIQFFNDFHISNPSTAATLEGHHNKVAILPFAFIQNEGRQDETVSERIQSETFALLKKHNGGLQYQDPINTNALLVDAGVTNNNINGFTMGEICNILGVEYVIQGTIAVQRTVQKNSSDTNSSTQPKKDAAYADRKGKLIGNMSGSGGQSSNSGFSNTSQNYSTTLFMNIYNDRGENIFSQEHSSFWNTSDAYKITLNFLTKKTPFYKK